MPSVDALTENGVPVPVPVLIVLGRCSPERFGRRRRNWMDVDVLQMAHGRVGGSREDAAVA